MSNAEIVEMALAPYIAGRPADTEVLKKARDEADEDIFRQKLLDNSHW